MQNLLTNAGCSFDPSEGVAGGVNGMLGITYNCYFLCCQAK